MDRNRIKAGLALLLAAPLLAACSSTPRTHLNWDVNDRSARAKSAPAPRRVQAAAVNTAPRTYVYEEYADAGAAPPVPTPRPNYVPVSTAPLYAARPAAPVHGDGAVFAWPVRGDVITGFGVTRNGTRNDGINIATPMASPIRASAGGTVTYAGSDLKSYGNLVLIKHDNGYVTAYAHAERLIVGRGDYVAKGQVIGYAGQTGDVTSPQLHFEIRQQTRPIDPRMMLARAAS